MIIITIVSKAYKFVELKNSDLRFPEYQIIDTGIFNPRLWHFLGLNRVVFSLEASLQLHLVVLAA